MMGQVSTPHDLNAKFEHEQQEPEKQWRVAARLFYANKSAVFGLIGFLIISLIGLFGPLVLQADPFAIVAEPLKPPGAGTYLGTDYLGRDVFVGLIYGARPTLIIAITATFFTVVIGMSIGAMAGFYGGAVDNLCMRTTEFFQVLPPLVLAMVIVAIFVPNFITLIFAISVVSWPSLARLTRAEFLKLKEREFIMAEKAMGAKKHRIILWVILPNAFPPLTIAITLRIGETIIYESALSFLGLTSQEIMTWGKMIGLSRDFFFEAWWTVTFPGVAILLTVLCIALIGDGLNEAFNPKLRGR